MSASTRAAYPRTPADRDRWLLERRGPRNRVDPDRAVASLLEIEPNEGGEPEPVAAIFLANRECPWRCLMCDLWKDTLAESVPPGAIPAQIRGALAKLPPARRVKLYNSGSFFDPKAIPSSDYEEIAALTAGFDRVIVESHPALVDDSSLRFRDLLGGPCLQVALGLETANEEILRRLNKGMTVADFENACRFLAEHAIRIRSFVLVGLPFLRKEEWAAATRESIDLSFRAGAEVVSLIPTRLGNGAMEELQRQGRFEPPTLLDLQTAVEDFLEGKEGNARARGLLLADLWNADALAAPACCRSARIERLRSMNLLQRNLPLPPCPSCRRHSTRASTRAGGVRSQGET